jgi:hypothetical protein
MKSFDEYQLLWPTMTVSEAMNIVLDLACHTEKVIVSNAIGNHAVEVWEWCEPIPGHLLAAHVYPIQFCGGPPDAYFWVTGTLRDFVIDKLMFADAMEERSWRNNGGNSKCEVKIPTIKNLGC